MNNEVLKYELSADVINYILNALNRNQIAGVEQARDLLSIIEILQNPLNKDDIEKKQYEALKGKFGKKN
jgi:hypothetical protein